MFAKLLFVTFLLTSLCAASQIYDLGLPCGPNSAPGCVYNNTNTNTTTTVNAGNTFFSEPGRTTESRWKSVATNRSDYYKNAGTSQNGWYQAVSGYGMFENSSSGFSDDYRYGCCSLDFWGDTFSSNSYYSLSQSGWGTLLNSDWETIILTVWNWGDFSESWSNYFRNAGETNWPGSRWSFDSASWSGGGSSSSWSYFSQTSYPDPSASPEPSTLFLATTGVVLFLIGKRRRRRV